MKNLKKVLALVLAFAMAFTMMATAGAAYTDQADIQATEAVDVLNALGVMTGDPDGSFRPNDTITRAEACRMIYTIRSGGNDDASAYAGMQTTFTDVPADAWYAGYVKHCQSVGIVSGKSSTIFDPNSNVTGVELALMCLRVMGYDPAKADIGGSTWSITTVGLATEAGLLDDVSTAIEADCPRQWAAQLMYNMIEASTVRWSDDLGGYSNTMATGAKYETVGAKYMDYATVTGILVETNKGEGKGFAVLPQDQNGNYDWTEAVWAENKYTTDLSGFLGEEVKVAFDSVEYAKKNASVYGVFSTDNNTVLTTSRNKVKMTNDSAKVKVDGTEYKIDSNNAKYITSAAVDSSLDNIKTAYNEAGLIKNIPTTDVNEGYTVKFVDYDNDNKFDLAIETPMTVGEVSSITSSKVTLKATTAGKTLANKSFEIADNTVDENLAKGDIAVVTYDYFNDKYVIAKADVTSGDVTATRSGEYKIGDEWAKVAASYVNDMPTVKAGDAVDAVIINGIIYYCDKTKGSTGTDVAMVVSTGATRGGAEDGKVEAKLMFTDGTTKVVNVETIIANDGAETETDLTDGTAVNEIKVLNQYLVTNDVYADGMGNVGPALVTYSTDNEGNYTLQKVNATHNDADYDAVAVSQAAGGSNGKIEKIGNYEIADDAVVLVTYGTSDAKKLTGKEVKRLALTNIKTTGGKASAMVSKESGYNYAKVVALNFTAKPDVTSGAEYGYLLTDAYVGSDKFTYFTLWTQNGYQEVKWDNNTSSNVLKDEYSEKAVISFDYDADGVIKNVEAVDMTKGAITAYNNDDKIDFLSSDGAAKTGVEIDDDTIILYVDTDDLDANTGSTNEGTMEVADDLVKDVLYTANVMYQKTITGNIADVIVYDINSNLDGDDIACKKTTGLTADNVNNLLDNAEKGDTVAINDIPDGEINVPAGVAVEVPADPKVGNTKFTLEAGAALKVAEIADSSTSSETLVGPAGSGARIETASNTEVTVDFSVKGLAAMKIAGDATIPERETWYSMFGPVANTARGLAMELTSGTLTVNGTLKLISGANGSSLKVSGDGKVVIAGTMEIAKKASVDGNNNIVGTTANSKIIIKGGKDLTDAGAITNISGLEGVKRPTDSTLLTYTWSSTNTWAQAGV